MLVRIWGEVVSGPTMWDASGVSIARMAFERMQWLADSWLGSRAPVLGLTLLRICSNARHTLQGDSLELVHGVIDATSFVSSLCLVSFRARLPVHGYQRLL